MSARGDGLDAPKQQSREEKWQDDIAADATPLHQGPALDPARIAESLAAAEEQELLARTLLADPDRVRDASPYSGTVARGAEADGDGPLTRSLHAQDARIEEQAQAGGRAPDDAGPPTRY